ncbi:sec-independent protein translocase protein TatB [Candidatus Planktophila dulcis]|jgi:sec-independent protein translocase protein TatB|uniref:Sec-independent protein translocase protein TatB n=1 Tax=Candidatus Planktophila dulcis TaxID=1884914 RepID=A0AAC9YU58_9ACTN|nr:sec-independent translocase [Candidatus Planktophila dulcis]ASY12324.1 sec-independent protein translocase protein TatB [Candidatus Planktophila dulcis]ASY21572.1 sec-independent protein translocase protein TatB [Candidatus Planktophila dulcis]
MFFDFGAGELVGLAILAMILIGPERLPNLAVDAAKFVKRIREMASKATEELKDNLGPGFEDLKPTDLNPKSFIKKQLSSVLDDDDSTPATSKRTSTIDPDLL